MSIENLKEEINKKFGEETILLFGDLDDQPTEIVSTGIPSLDAATGVGGFPLGRIIEIYGKEAGGKTSLSLHHIAEAQKKGLQVAYMDLEFSLDHEYAQRLGVDMDNVLVSQPKCAEDVFEIIEKLAMSGEISIIVLDSVAALATRAMINGQMGDANVAGIPRLLSSSLPKLVPTLSKNNCSLVLVNQLRDIIGGFGYGPTETTPGGRAIKFYASARIDVRRIGDLKIGEQVIGHKAKIKITKNKVGIPKKSVEVDLIYGEGFSKESDLLDVAVKKGVIIAKGAWFAFAGANFAQGKEKARLALKDAEFYDKVSEAVNNNE